MAKFYAITEADIVGTTDSLPFPVAVPVTGTTSALLLAFSIATDYFIYNTSAPGFGPAVSLTSGTHFATPTPFAFGAGPVQDVWTADPGDSYLLGTAGTASLDTFFGLVLTAKVGDPTKTHGTEQQINQFLFKFEDSIHGSDEDDKLCGWAEDDDLWGGDGDDEFFYGEGMGVDTIKDFKVGDDELVLDDSVAEKFKDLKGDVKFKNNGSVVINAGGGEKLIVFGIDTTKELKNALSFDDFTDFA